MTAIVVVAGSAMPSFFSPEFQRQLLIETACTTAFRSGAHYQARSPKNEVVATGQRTTSLLNARSPRMTWILDGLFLSSFGAWSPKLGHLSTLHIAFGVALLFFSAVGWTNSLLPAALGWPRRNAIRRAIRKFATRRVPACPRISHQQYIDYISIWQADTFDQAVSMLREFEIDTKVAFMPKDHRWHI